MTQNRPKVALLVAPTTSAAVLYGMFDVLYSVGAVYPDMVLGAPGSEQLDVRIVSADGAPFRCPGHVLVEPHDSLVSVGRPDVVIVCDMYSPIYSVPRADYALYRPWLRDMHRQGVLVGSVCSGALVLAEAGLLHGKAVASHWAYAELFAREYPRSRLQRDSVLCLAHEADGIVTAGGVTSWQELVLYVIRRLCGPDAARQTAKVHLLAGHEQGQLPYAMMNRNKSSNDAIIMACLDYIAQSYNAPNPVQRMVERSGLNARTFTRRFRAATGRSAIEYVVALRIEEAKQMLEASQAGVEEISRAVGYEDPAAFRRVFHRETGATATEHRKRFSRSGLA